MPKPMQTCPPPEALSPWVTGFVLRDEPGFGQAVRLLPEPRATIQIVLGDPYWLRERSPGSQWSPAPEAGLWGPRYAWCFGWPQGHIRILGIGLTPMALRNLSFGPAREVVNRIVPLDSLAPGLVRALKTLPADEFGEMIQIAARSLAAALEGYDPFDPINHQALECLATQGGGAVAKAARLCEMSERQFRRVFEGSYGVTPKLYQRVRRIDRMIRALHPKPWETDALKDHESGFADQPHMIREFQALTGLTPEAYAQAMARAGGAILRSVPEEGVTPPP